MTSPAAADYLPPGWETWAPDRKQVLLNELVHAEFRARYEFDPAGFVQDCIKWPAGEGPTSYQLDVLEALIHEKRVAMRGPHGLGKSSIAAFAIHWFALTRDGDNWKNPNTASRWRQLQIFLWPEVHKWAPRLDWEKIGRPPYDPVRELQTLNLKLKTGQAFTVASNDPAAIEGAHADRVLYVFDEAKTLTEAMFTAAEGAFAQAGEDTDKEAFALVLSTPGEPQGPFYEIHRRSPHWKHYRPRSVTLEQAIDAGQISAKWAEEKAEVWGTNSATYKNRVLGDFATDAGQSVIPLEWVEAANDRWYELAVQDVATREWRIPEEVLEALGFYGVGWDVAEEGEGDDTVLALRWGNVIGEIRRPPFSPDLMVATGQVSGILNGKGGFASVDVIGIGGGPVSRLRELRHKVVPFDARHASDAFDESGELQYANLRAEAWFGMRDRLNPDPARNPDPSLMPALPPDDKLTGDLTAPKKKVTSSGKLLIESKADIFKRIQRSTDTGDAVVMIFWARYLRARSSSPAGQTLPSPGRGAGVRAGAGRMGR